MGPENHCIRFAVFLCLLMMTTLNPISADPPSTDFLAFYDSSIESNPDEFSFGPDQPGSLPFDDSSFMVSALSDSSDIDAKGSYFWKDYGDTSVAADWTTLDSSCQTGDNFLFDDDSLAGDGILQARRDDDAGMCSIREEDPAIDSGLDSFRGSGINIPKIFTPTDLTKQKKLWIPPDPVGSFVGEYGECFLPYLSRCCCSGSYAWGGTSIWGHTLQYIWDCSVGMYAALHDPTIPKVRLVD